MSVDSHTSATFFGQTPSISVDSNNNPHIVYRGIDPTGSTTNSALAYATCTSSCLFHSSSWLILTADGRGGAAWGTSIAVNQGNNSVHIVYVLSGMGGDDIYYLSTDTAPYSISPDLPRGLSLDWGTGTISGTPTELFSSTIHTITARNSHGTDTTTLTLSVNAPPSLTYDWGSGSSNFHSSEYVNNKVSVGWQNTCAIRENGSLMCWGQDDKGQLGNGATTTTSQDEPVYVNLPTGRKAVAVSAGALNACAILDNGSMMCWGADNVGQLGNGAATTTDQDEPVYVSLPSGRTAVDLTVGWAHACAILDTGSLMCWGWGSNGVLGDGENTNKFSPVSVDLPYGRTAVAVDAGEKHTCAILDTGSLMCWGRDHRGQLGDGAGYNDRHSPPLTQQPWHRPNGRSDRLLVRTSTRVRYT